MWWCFPFPAKAVPDTIEPITRAATSPIRAFRVRFIFALLSRRVEPVRCSHVVHLSDSPTRGRLKTSLYQIAPGGVAVKS